MPASIELTRPSAPPHAVNLRGTWGRRQVGLGGALAVGVALRAWCLRWGATDAEADMVSLVVAALGPGRSLVLRGGIPIGNRAPPYDFTWAFALRDGPDDTTRLLVRERYLYTRPWARVGVEPAEALSFVMSHKMLRGIKVRSKTTATP